MHYHIIENTPSYMPDADEPYTVETEEEARNAIDAIVADWRDAEAEVTEYNADGSDWEASVYVADDGLSASITDRPGYMHDLGRVAVASICVEVDCEVKE